MKVNRSKWAWKSSKDPKYIQNDPIWAQYLPKWTQIIKFKWAEESLNELIRALMSSSFNKILPVMHISTRYILHFLKRPNKCRKFKLKKNIFVAHFYKVSRPRPLTPFDFRPEFCAKWKASVNVAIISNLFCLVFHETLAQI